MGLFDRHAGLLEAYRDVRTTGIDPFQIRMERVLSPTEAIINGKPTLLVGTNNYFGLTFDPSCMEAAIAAIRKYGSGCAGSRMFAHVDHHGGAGIQLLFRLGNRDAGKWFARVFRGHEGLLLLTKLLKNSAELISARALAVAGGA